jgi:hypothetical protein
VQSWVFDSWVNAVCVRAVTNASLPVFSFCLFGTLCGSGSGQEFDGASDDCSE